MHQHFKYKTTKKTKKFTHNPPNGIRGIRNYVQRGFDPEIMMRRNSNMTGEGGLMQESFSQQNLKSTKNQYSR